MASHATILRGEFVDLRPLTVADAETTFRWRQSTRSTRLNQGAQSAAQQAEWIAGRPSSEFNFVIEMKGGRPVGMLSLVAIDMLNRRAEPGRFLIGDEAATKGIPVAVEAMKLLYALAFDELDLLRVYGTIASNNHLVIKWQKYLGMKEEGRLRRHYFNNGAFHDAVILGLLVDEYREVTLPRMNALIAAGRAQSAVA
jgi:RimJ/RimL family protein N-acetyltransferase